MEVFQDYALYYNEFYQDKDYVAETSQIDLLLKQYGKNVKKVINYGCGTGKHDIELSKLGYHCTGIDMSPLMVNIARENCKREDLKINFSVSDIRYYIPSAKYDAVLSLFHVISYQNRNEDILSAFAAARAALDKGGIFLFDVWYGPGVLSDKPEIRVKEIENMKYKLIRIARPIMHDKTDIVDVCYEIIIIDKKTSETKVINEVHNMRYYFKPELEFYLSKSGFELINNLDCKTLETTNYNSWTSYFIAKAV